LLESCLRCLSNLYTSSQMCAFLVYQLDKQLYSSNNLDLILKYFPLTNQTKHTVLNILTISATCLCAASIKFQFNSNLATSNTTFARLDANLRRFRNDLIKSDAIKKFASLLISSHAKTQLNALKFYAATCFESVEACKIMLNSDFYDVSLLELISAFLSRENTTEMQLYAAKCLTNLCRCSLLITKSSQTQVKEKQVVENSMDVSELITTTTTTSSTTKTPPASMAPPSSHKEVIYFVVVTLGCPLTYPTIFIVFAEKIRESISCMNQKFWRFSV
jgi:hypothetical protein